MSDQNYFDGHLQDPMLAYETHDENGNFGDNDSLAGSVEIQSELSNCSGSDIIGGPNADVVYSPRKSIASGRYKRRKKTPHKETAKNNIFNARARPMKNHESSPFLYIDNLPEDKLKQQLDRKSTMSSSKVGQRPQYSTPPMIFDNVPPNTRQYPNSSRYTPLRQTPNGGYSPIRMGSAAGRSTPGSDWNPTIPRFPKYLQPDMIESKPNAGVTQPFKHSVHQSQPLLGKRSVTPSGKMKYDSLRATYQIARAMAKQHIETEQRIQGRLLKAKLKPLTPVKVTGPTVHHCRGIVSEARNHGANISRTLQRRREIVANLNKENMQERPDTSESIHRTSIASDVTIDRINELKDDLEQAEERQKSQGTPPNTANTKSDVLTVPPVEADTLNTDDNKVVSNEPQSAEEENDNREQRGNHKTVGKNEAADVKTDVPDENATQENYTSKKNGEVELKTDETKDIESSNETSIVKQGSENVMPPENVRQEDRRSPAEENTESKAEDKAGEKSPECKTPEYLHEPQYPTIAQLMAQMDAEEQTEKGEDDVAEVTKLEGDAESRPKTVEKDTAKTVKHEEVVHSRPTEPVKIPKVASLPLVFTGRSDESEEPASTVFLTQDRPQTVGEQGRKAVRFSDQIEHNEQRRVKSAMPRMYTSAGSPGIMKNSSRPSSRERPNSRDSTPRAKVSPRISPRETYEFPVKQSSDAGLTAIPLGSITEGSVELKHDDSQENFAVKSHMSSVEEMVGNSTNTNATTESNFNADENANNNNGNGEYKSDDELNTNNNGIIKGDEEELDRDQEAFIREAMGEEVEICLEKKPKKNSKPKKKVPAKEKGKVLINDMVDGDVEEKPRVRVRRPRTKLGFWEDLQKADDNVADMKIEGEKQVSCSMALVPFDEKSVKQKSVSIDPESYLKSGTKRAYGQRFRPKSANLGPKLFMKQEEEKKRELTAKLTASQCFRSISADNFQVDGELKEFQTRPFGTGSEPLSIEYRPKKASTKTPERSQNRLIRPSSANSALRSSSAQNPRRPQSAAKNGVSNQVFYNLDRRPRTSTAGQVKVDIRKAKNKHFYRNTTKAEKKSLFSGYCIECNCPVEQYMTMTEYNTNCVICDNCKPSVIGQRQAYNRQQTAEDRLVNNIYRNTIARAVNTLENENIERVIQHQEAQPPVNTNHRCSLPMNLEELEESLNHVQEEIKSHIEQTRLDRVPEPYPEGGVISEVLTNQDKYEEDLQKTPMRVYQFSEGNEGNQGDISTYSVALQQDSTAMLGFQSQGVFSTEVVEETEKTANSSQPRQNTAPVAPMAPLCFKVNARPPSGYLYYFAYGLDMNQHRLSTYLKRDITETFWGLLFGFRLLFNRKGESEEAGTFPNIEPCEGSSVEGSLCLITEEELKSLDTYMGYPQYLEHVMLPVWMLNCSEPEEMGVAQFCIPALMYIARDRSIQRDITKIDSRFAVDECIRAADNLSPDYKKYLDTIKMVAEKNAEVLGE